MPNGPYAKLAELIPRLSRYIAVHLEAGEHPISVSQYYVLQRIASGTTRAVDLARRARVSGPTMSGIVDRLYQGGFITRETSADDRRASDMGLTPAGRALLGERTASLEAAFGEMLAGISPREADELDRACLVLAAALDERVRIPN